MHAINISNISLSKKNKKNRIPIALLGGPQNIKEQRDKFWGEEEQTATCSCDKKEQEHNYVLLRRYGADEGVGALIKVASGKFIANNGRRKA